MKKVIFGGIMMFAGVISTAILLSGTMVTSFVHNVEYTYAWSLSRAELRQPLIFFIIIIVVGLILGIWGMIERDDKK